MFSLHSCTTPKARPRKQIKVVKQRQKQVVTGDEEEFDHENDTPETEIVDQVTLQ